MAFINHLKELASFNGSFPCVDFTPIVSSIVDVDIFNVQATVLVDWVFGAFVGCIDLIFHCDLWKGEGVIIDDWRGRKTGLVSFSYRQIVIVIHTYRNF